MSERSRRIGAVTAALAAVVLATSSCATANPGDAAVVGGTSIPQATIGEQLRAVNEAVGEAPDTANAEVTKNLVYGNVVVELVRQTADGLSVTVPQAQLDEYYQQQVQAAGGEEELKTALAEQGIAPQLIDGFVRATLLQQAIANQLVPSGDPQAQDEALRAEVARVADEAGVSVSPKYGVWDSETLQIVDRSDPVTSPAAGIGLPSPAPVP